jgi:vacuolar-type H+-ATPase subunit H
MLYKVIYFFCIFQNGFSGRFRVVKSIVDKIKEAEDRAEKVIKDAEADVEAQLTGFEKERERRLKGVEEESGKIREKLLAEADKKGSAEESKILDEAQQEMNKLRAKADKRKDEAISLILSSIGHSRSS